MTYADIALPTECRISELDLGFKPGQWVKYPQRIMNTIPNDGSRVVAPGVCESQGATCDKGGNVLNASCFQLTSIEVDTFDQASELCQAAGAALVSITSAEENDMVAELCSTRSQTASDIDTWWKNLCWIGLVGIQSEAGDTWRWESGEEISYESWANQSKPSDRSTDGPIVPTGTSIGAAIVQKAKPVCGCSAGLPSSPLWGLPLPVVQLLFTVYLANRSRPPSSTSAVYLLQRHLP